MTPTTPQHDRDEPTAFIEDLVFKHATTVDRWLKKGRTIGEAYAEANREANVALQQLIDTHVAAIERSAFERGQRVGQYQAADKLYGYVTTVWLFRDSDDPKALKMNVERTDDMLKDCEKLLNHNAKVYQEYVAQLRTTQETDKPHG